MRPTKNRTICYPSVFMGNLRAKFGIIHTKVPHSKMAVSHGFLLKSLSFVNLPITAMVTLKKKS